MNSIRMTLRNLSLLAALACCASASAEDAAQPAAKPASAAAAPAGKAPAPAAAAKAPGDAPVVSSAPPAAGKKSCEDVKAEIEAKLKAKGVKAFTLDIVPAANVKDAKVVGNCAGGAKKITYKRG